MATGITITVIMNTTQINRNLLPLWWMVWVAILLILFGVPSFLARAIHLSGEDARLALLDGKKIADQYLDDCDFGRKLTSSWYPTNASFNDLALIALERAGRAVGKTEADQYRKEAELWQRKALQVSPADPYGWYRLSYLYYMSDGPSQRSAEAWKQSFSSAPYEPRLLVPRLQMAMGLGGFLDDQARQFIPRLARDAWREDAGGLLNASVEGAFTAVVESALQNDPDALADYRSYLQQR